MHKLKRKRRGTAPLCLAEIHKYKPYIYFIFNVVRSFKKYSVCAFVLCEDVLILN